MRKNSQNSGEEIRHLMLLHLGLGDMIICNGLVRAWLLKNPSVTKLEIPCRQSDTVSVQWMYRDEPRVKLIRVPDRNPYPFIAKNLKPAWEQQNLPVTDLTCFGVHSGDFNMDKFDKEFYRLAEIPFTEKWDAAKFDRDQTIEKPARGAVILHDDPSRSFTISRKRYPDTLQATHVQDFNQTNVFSLLGALEQADELHVINSSILNLMEFATPKEGQKRFWHFYARPELSIPTLRLPWEKLD